jgi:hypothetical protein
LIDGKVKKILKIAKLFENLIQMLIIVSLKILRLHYFF